MKYKISMKAAFIVLLLSGLLPSRLLAQSAILTTGGNSTGSGGSMSYSIGQVSYKMNMGTGNSETQGVQQPVISCVASDWYADTDNDGYGAGAAIPACTQPANTSTFNTDCNDADATIKPDAAEICNSIDDDCDMSIDEDLPTTTYYQDADHDGKGNPAVSIVSCSQPIGYVTNNTDCADNSTAACPKPSSLMTADITDISATASWSNLPCASKYRFEFRRKTPPISAWTVVYTTVPYYNITGLTAGNISYQWRVAAVCTPSGTGAESGYAAIQTFNTRYRVYTDADMDGFGDGGAPTVFVASFPQPGYSANNTDCNDASATSYPGAPELCNGIDDDCDLIVDEGASWYQDADGDGLGNFAVSQDACAQPPGYVSNSLDCNDNSSSPICSNPVNLLANNIGATFATVAWTGSPCASGYTVMYRINPAGTWSGQLNTTNPFRQLSGLIAGTTYQFRVRAKCPSPNPKSTSAWVYGTFTTQTGPMGLAESSDPQSNIIDPGNALYHIYPNPAKNFVMLSIDPEVILPVTYMLYDMQGKILMEQKVEDINTRIEMKNLSNGTYFIKVFNDIGALETFKVLKI